MASERSPRIRILLWLIGCGFLVFLALQFVRPSLTNPPVTADVAAPPQVKAILRNSCYNCHSNETRIPWFDQVVPAYWLVTSDVKEGRADLNFSEIGAQPAAKQKGILYESVNQIRLGAMPPPSYQMVHPGSVVTSEQMDVLMAYLNPPAPAVAASQADVQAADAQYATWVRSGSQSMQVQSEWNGVAFIPDYKNWHAVSSTDRFDNNTMRVILGNDIAIKAIAEHQINPWPDGTVFAKVTWHEQPDASGFVKTGAFAQVELMIRDSKKYGSTLGWGWGRWLGTDLKPYGKGPEFQNECVNCHTPVIKNDSVYTFPIARSIAGQP